MEGTNQQQPLNLGAQVEVDLALGRSGKDADKKNKKKTVDELAEERMKQTFNVGGSAKDTDDLKRKREDFAV